MGTADRHPDNRALLLLHLRPAAVDLQPVHRRDRDLRHAVAVGPAPVLYEDGRQTRDFCYVEDVARANMLAATSDQLDGMAVNVASGVPTSIRAIARMVADGLGIAIEPVARGEFRPGEIRYLTSDISRAVRAGYSPTIDIATGIDRYLAWIRTLGAVRDYFAAAEQVLRERRIVQQVAARS